ncbi:MAG: hypothetical protein ACJ8AK_03935 [Gemmatimonadaceae bacterium]
MKTRRFAVGVAIALTGVMAVGCGDSTAPVDVIGLTITAPVTVHFTNVTDAGYRQIAVEVKIKNSTSKVITRGWCSESLERFHGAGWEDIWSPVCLANFVDSPIQPGATETVSMSIADTPPQYSGFRFTDPENQYRIRFQVYVGGDDGTAALSVRAATNVFEVVP